MKRDEIGSLVRRGLVPWVERLPEARGCLTVLMLDTRRSCARPGAWAFTADGRSFHKGGVYCWSHLMMIVSSGEEQARLEDHLRTSSEV